MESECFLSDYDNPASGNVVFRPEIRRSIILFYDGYFCLFIFIYYF